MAKRTKKDSSCISMSSLIQHIMMDGKVHTLNEISKYVQQYMYKSGSMEMVKNLVQTFMDSRDDYEQTKTGYVLQAGESLKDLVARLLQEANEPTSEKEITKKVAKEQNVPQQSVDLDLEKDKRFTKLDYKTRAYYYLSNRKKINKHVHEILKDRERPMTFSEIYKALESEKELEKKDVIFIPRGDRKISRQAGPKFSLKTTKTRKKKQKPIHYVSKQELDKIVTFIETKNRKMTPDEIAEEILKRPLKETNLRVRLTRDNRLVRHDQRFFVPEQEKEVEIPQKVIDRIESNFFKVKAKLMGSRDPLTIDNLLDSVYKIGVANDEYKFYRDLLFDQLKSDSGVVSLRDKWVQRDADKRSKWEPTEHLFPIDMPEPRPPFNEDTLTDIEKEFLGIFVPVVEELESEEDAKIYKVRHYVSSANRYHGAIFIDDSLRKVFPEKPMFYEALWIGTREGKVYAVFVNNERGYITFLDEFMQDHMPIEGGYLEIQPDLSEPFQFTAHIEQTTISADLSDEVIDVLISHRSINDNLADLMRKIAGQHGKEAFRLDQLWAEVSLLADIRPRDFIAIIKDYKCFVPDKELGFFRFNELKSDLRVSVPVKKKKAKKIKPEKAVKEDDADKPKIATATIEKKPAKTPVKTAKPDIAKPKPKKEFKRKKEEQLPDHLRRLERFGRKLPGIRPSKTMVVKSDEKQGRKRIGAVSVGRIEKSFNRTKTHKVEDDLPLLLDVPPKPDTPEEWNAGDFVNPNRDAGHAELNTTLEVLKVFISRTPRVRKTDGSIVIFLDTNDISLYFRVPPENQDCWLVWIPEKDISAIENGQEFLVENGERAKHSDRGYWWSTGRFKGPKGNAKDKNVLEGVKIVEKILKLNEKTRKD